MLLLSGCGPAFHNQPLARYEPESGYRFDNLAPGEGNSDELFVCLSFSGGGARAGALSYAVLQELRDTPLAKGGPDGGLRLLDEVDLISSVSGGSFTAAGYALWRERLFDGRFEREFLRRNVQFELLYRIFAFPNILQLPYVVLDRIDIVAEYFDKRLFRQRTYADLLADGRRPFIVVNATNIGAGQRFEFTQSDFDLLGSDLSRMPIGYAVAASQAVPIILSPLRLKYYAGPASSAALADVLAEPLPRPKQPRRQKWARTLVPTTRPGQAPIYRLADDEHRYLYLQDGAVSDNLGLSCIIEQYRSGEIRRRLESTGPDRIRRLVVVVVNAGTVPDGNIEAQSSAPGLLKMGYTAATISINNYSNALVMALRSTLVEESARLRDQYVSYHERLRTCCPSEPPLPPPLEMRFEPYVIEVNFQDVPDEAVRKALTTLPTNYNLTSEQVDLVLAHGRRLLREHPDFLRLVRDLRGAQRD